MPAKNPRINVVLEKPVYDAIRKIAKKEGISISLKATDLLRGALEIYEDNILKSIASQRERTFDRRNTLTGDDVWMDRPASSQED
jgi:hypothetical protein